jgi:NADH-quinone oxidoreductase subunit M
MPGTLGFPGEDLLIHGMLTAHPVMGMMLPVAIAINAYLLYRLFSRLFLGAPVAAWTGVSDALPRERWAFAACLAILVWGGLMPQQVVALRSTALEFVASLPGTEAHLRSR